MTVQTRPLLVVLNPRQIEECMASFLALHVDIVFLRNYTESEIAKTAWPRVMSIPWADPISVVSDDTIVTQTALATVLALQATYPGLCVTGWCPLADGHELCNLSRKLLPAGPPNEDSYDFMTCEEARAPRHHLISSTFAGMALTTMSRKNWERFPFGVYGEDGPGFASDYHLSYRLQRPPGVPIVSHRDAEIRHVKKTWNQVDRTPGRELRVGREPSQFIHRSPFPGCENFQIRRAVA